MAPREVRGPGADCDYLEELELEELDPDEEEEDECGLVPIDSLPGYSGEPAPDEGNPDGDVGDEPDAIPGESGTWRREAIVIIPPAEGERNCRLCGATANQHISNLGHGFIPS
jgi:hypothetical protein